MQKVVINMRNRLTGNLVKVEKIISESDGTVYAKRNFRYQGHTVEPV